MWYSYYFSFKRKQYTTVAQNLHKRNNTPVKLDFFLGYLYNDESISTGDYDTIKITIEISIVSYFSERNFPFSLNFTAFVLWWRAKSPIKLNILFWTILFYNNRNDCSMHFLRSTIKSLLFNFSMHMVVMSFDVLKKINVDMHLFKSSNNYCTSEVYIVMNAVWLI